MTDKKQIIIDGKGCRYKTWDKDCALSGDNHGDNMQPCKFIDEKNCYYKQLKRKEQECEELKKQLMQKSEVDMFFNTPIEGWSNDPCGICPHKAENEELKKEIVNKNEKIKELRFSVSDLTNRLCSLNAEKSFRIVDLEQALDEIKSICNKTCEVCQIFEKCDKEFSNCKNAKMLNIINKTKDGKNEQL